MSNSSDNEKSQEKPEDLLSAFSLGPAWARDSDKDQKKSYSKKYKDDDGRGGQSRDGKGRNFKGKRPRGTKGGQGRFNKDGRGDKPGFRRQDVPAPDYVTAEIMPYEEALDRAAKEIVTSARTQEVFYLAKLILSSRDRYRVNFKSTDESKKLIYCRKDGSVWLSREDALAHFKRAEWKKDFYEKVVSECEPPKGSFSAVAKCSISGELLGPPNYHGYQERLHTLHAERFSNMPLDRYRSKIVTEKGEEVVEAWLKAMSQKVNFRPYGEDRAEALEKEEEKLEESVEEKAQLAEEVEVSADQDEEKQLEASEIESQEEKISEADIAEAEEFEGEDVSERAENEETPIVEENLLENLSAVERHFLANHFDAVFIEQAHVYAEGNITAKMLSPALLTLLKNTVVEEKRYPGNLAAFMCRQLSGRHLAIFKWKGKLKAGPARPHAIPSDILLADRPKSILEWLKSHDGSNITSLWPAVLPENPSDEDKKQWYGDLHWLINQGYVLFMHDGVLQLAKQPAKAATVQPKKKEEKSVEQGVKEKKSETADTEKPEAKSDQDNS